MPKGIVFSTTSGKAIVQIGYDRKVYVNRKQVFLSPLEYRFLFFLAEGMGQVRTVPMLLAYLYPKKKKLDLNILQVLAHNIRETFTRVHPDAENIIRTVWGRGYAFGEPALLPVPVQMKFHPRTKNPLRVRFRGVYAKLSHLIPGEEGRWGAVRKARVIRIIKTRLASVQDILSYYPDLSREELQEWERIFKIRPKKKL